MARKSNTSTKRGAKSEPATKTVKLVPAAAEPQAAREVAAEPVKAKIVTPAKPVDSPKAPQMKKAEFLEAVVERSQVKKRDAKPAVEAALELIAETLLAGGDLNLQPMGKIKVVKEKELADGARALTLKLRTPRPAAEAGGGLAKAGKAG